MINNINLEKINKIFFLGVGGIGMSAMARMMHHKGKKVIGSDAGDNRIVHDLRNEGYLVHLGQSIDNIPNDIDLIIYSEAVEDHHPEFLEEVRNQFSATVISYPQMLGVVSRETFTIAIAGTHGKTTTTSMIATMLIDAEKHPTVIVGSILAREQSNFISGSSDIFVVESCEYKRSFLNIKPNILVITNIEEDHMDYYRDIEDIQAAFRGLVRNMPSDGVVIARTSDPVVQAVLVDNKTRVIDYAQFIDQTINLRVPGEYNFQNAACAVAVADVLNINKTRARTSLEKFQGVWRRFEYKGKTKREELIYDDYAHHPTEIRSVLTATKKIFPNREIVAIFEPHLFSRTKLLFDDFVTSFFNADRIILAPIYFAREEDDGSMSSQMLGEALELTGKKVFVGRSYDHILKYLETTDTSGAIIMTIGAGPIFQVGEKLLESRGIINGQ